MENYENVIDYIKSGAKHLLNEHPYMPSSLKIEQLHKLADTCYGNNEHSKNNFRVEFNLDGHSCREVCHIYYLKNNLEKDHVSFYADNSVYHDKHKCYSKYKEVNELMKHFK